MRRASAAAALLGLALVACGGDSSSPAGAGPSKVTIATKEFAFNVATSFKGGLVEVTLDNSAGTEPHEAEFIRLDAGKTMADYKATLDHDGPPPAWANEVAGPGPVMPGKTAVYTGNFEAGTYILVCHVPSSDGKSHLSKGMAAEVTLTEGKTGALPAGDVKMTMEEFRFTGVEGLKAGTQTVHVSNPGKQEHHMAVFQLAPGKKIADLLAFFSPQRPAGPPPFVGITGLIATTPPGGAGVRTLELTAGTTYGFVCFIPDTDGKPHIAKGMAAELTAK